MCVWTHTHTQTSLQICHREQPRHALCDTTLTYCTHTCMQTHTHTHMHTFYFNRFQKHASCLENAASTFLPWRAAQKTGEKKNGGRWQRKRSPVIVSWGSPSSLCLSVCRSLTTQYVGKQRFWLVFGQSLRMGSVQRMTEEPVFLFLVLVLASRSGFVHLDCRFHPPSRLILEKTTQGEKGEE